MMRCRQSLVRAGLLVVATLIPALHAHAQDEAPPRNLCRLTSTEVDRLLAASRSSGELLRVTYSSNADPESAPEKRYVPVRTLAGGKMERLVLSSGDNANDADVYCFVLRPREPNDSSIYARLVPGSSETAEGTELSLSVPSPGMFFGDVRRLAILGFHRQDPGNGSASTPPAPVIAVERSVYVSNGRFAAALAILGTLVAYVVAVLALRRKGERLSAASFNPVRITAGYGGRASLSKLQVWSFTLLVFGLLLHTLIRYGVLSDLSTDVLMLLGVSAGGAAAGKWTSAIKRRISAANWAWLKNQGWVAGFTDRPGQRASRAAAKVEDLLCDDGELDPYRFQLAMFSVLVGVSLLYAGQEALGRFEIPANLVLLLGVSNLVYVSGKAVKPESHKELDDKLNEVREAAKKLELVVRRESRKPETEPASDQAPELSDERLEAQTEYLTTARDAARILVGLFGDRSTKFAEKGFADTELLPRAVTDPTS